MYKITATHFRDMFGRFIWAEPLKTESRLYRIGEEFIWDAIKYRVERMAVVDNVQQVNVMAIYEDVNIVEPYL